MKKDIIKYSEIFVSVLQKHFGAEFEVQIRDGIVTHESEKCLEIIGQDFAVLQYQNKICQIFQTHSSKLHGSARGYILDLLDFMEDRVIDTFHDLIRRRQDAILRLRRQKNTDLCSKKCANGSTIFNFTDLELKPGLESLLKNGLKNVPIIKSTTEDLLREIELETIIACKNLFFSYYGHYPILSKDTFSKTIQNIISQCQANSEVVNKLVLLRENFIENVPYFCNSLKNNNVAEAKDLMQLLPHNCVVSPSDKGVGISVLPYDWYCKEYESQVRKGGHEQIQMSEDQCLAMLHRKISDFKQSCTEDQKKILSKYWPRAKIDKYRIGVLKLVPKVS